LITPYSGIPPIAEKAQSKLSMRKKMIKTQDVVRDENGKTRRNYSHSERIRIVMEGIRGKCSVAELCRREGIKPSLYYRWRKEFFEGGKQRLSGNNRWHTRDNEVKALRLENNQLKTLAGGLNLKADLLKKSLIGRGRRSKRSKPFSQAEKMEIIHLVGQTSNSVKQTLAELGIIRSTFYKWYGRYRAEGYEGLANRYTPKKLKAKDSKNVSAVFSVLHSPPSEFGINRTSWRMKDLQRCLAESGFALSLHTIRKIIKDAGYKWKKAKIVLTSSDPNYRQKVDRIKEILSSLKEDERFFSIDEFGPFAVKVKGGRRLVGPSESPSVPQFQKSKGCLIVTAALELSKNQVTHFYSKKKNTDEMIRMWQCLLETYRGYERLFLSWDAASWHISKKLQRKVDQINRSEYRQINNTPLVELAPLPASAQFLNVIESVFSGMARAIIHNSNYQSVEEAMTAINRYFRERNEYFLKYPKRAGKKIWGEELVTTEFCETKNFKDPKYR